jgi:pimeloyl-ACP methyl ester carboxylesterase
MEFCMKHTASSSQINRNDSDRLIDIGGLRMHIRHTGKGNPPVILESGAGYPGMSWRLVQRGVETFTSVISYDRAGQGLSEPSKTPRTSQNIAKELHTLLHAAGIPGPYVLAGHSLGGIHIRTFSALYPNEVAGLILVDSSHENQIELTHKADPPPLPWIERIKQFLAKKSNLIAYAFYRYDVKKRNDPLLLKSFSKEEQQEFDYLRLRYQHFLEVKKTGELIERSIAELKKMNRSLGDKPLTVITAGKSNLPCSQNPAMLAFFKKWEQIWNDLQKDLTTLSTCSSQVVAHKSGHMIPFEEPEIIILEIKKMILQLRENKDAADI